MNTTLKVSNTKLRYFLMGKLMTMSDFDLIQIADQLYYDERFFFLIDNYGRDDSTLDRI